MINFVDNTKKKDSVQKTSDNISNNNLIELDNQTNLINNDNNQQKNIENGSEDQFIYCDKALQQMKEMGESISVLIEELQKQQKGISKSIDDVNTVIEQIVLDNTNTRNTLSLICNKAIDVLDDAENFKKDIENFKKENKKQNNATNTDDKNNGKKRKLKTNNNCDQLESENKVRKLNNYINNVNDVISIENNNTSNNTTNQKPQNYLLHNKNINILNNSIKSNINNNHNLNEKSHQLLGCNISKQKTQFEPQPKSTQNIMNGLSYTGKSQQTKQPQQSQQVQNKLKYQKNNKKIHQNNSVEKNNCITNITIINETDKFIKEHKEHFETDKNSINKTSNTNNFNNKHNKPTTVLIPDFDQNKLFINPLDELDEKAKNLCHTNSYPFNLTSNPNALDFGKPSENSSKEPHNVGNNSNKNK